MFNRTAKIMPDEIAYFVHISDTHIGPDAAFSRHGHTSLPAARRVVEVINRLPTTPDFVIHTGDVVYDPDPAAYRLAAETFAPLQVPIYYVVGNHDRAQDIHHFLEMGPKIDCSPDRETLSYAFEVKGYRFLVLDGRGPKEIDPHGYLAESQLALVREEARANGPPLTIFLHFPVLPLNSIWMDENMLLLNRERLHEALLPARERLRGVFHGHVHQHMQTSRDGITYTSVASVFSQFAAWPGDKDIVHAPDRRPGYAFVHMMPDQTIVHQHSFVRTWEEEK